MALKIAVFDSGAGGRYIANKIKAQLPAAEIILKTDQQHIPYGDKTKSQLISYLEPILADFEAQEVAVVVIACSTVSTNIMTEVRQLTKLPLITAEPALELAGAVSQSRTVMVCATPATLASQYYQQLKQAQPSLNFVEPDCSDWASLVETDKFPDSYLDNLVSQAKASGADTIVWSCTHFLWLTDRLHNLNTQLKIVEPTQLVIEQLFDLLKVDRVVTS